MELTNTQNSIIIGSLLGDGCISKPIIYKPTGNIKSQSYFIKSQARKSREYLEWHFEQLKPFSSNLYDGMNYAKGICNERSAFRTSSNKIFTELRKKWYPNGKKIVPKDLELNSLLLAVWYADDGCIRVRKRELTISTCGFNIIDCEYLVLLLKKYFNIESSVGCGNIIFVKAKYIEKFIEIVRPFMPWECYQYKLLLCEMKHKKYPKYLEWNGETKGIVEWSKDERCSVDRGTIRYRLLHGWSVEKAITASKYKSE